ncbi:hypothetical protein REPUB_Repub01dG0094100 [Reevesia pubescens]
MSMGKASPILFMKKAVDEGIAKITINRRERINAFRPQTIKELIRAFNDARDDSTVGVIIFTRKVQRHLPKPVIAMDLHHAFQFGFGL